MKRRLFGVATLLLLTTTLVSSPASANQTVNCSTSGSITIVNDVVTTNTACTGSVAIPDTVTSIGASAFWFATGLRTVTFGSDSRLTSIDAGAFQMATGLQSIAIPDTVTAIGFNAFNFATALTSVSFGPNSQLTSIYPSGFSYATSLRSITLPPTLMVINSHAFASASSLTSVTFLGPAPIMIGPAQFQGLPSGAKALVSRAHVGSGAGKFGNVSSTWNGLVVEVPSPTLSLSSVGSVTTQTVEFGVAPTNPQLSRLGFTLAGWSSTHGSAATFAADLSDFTMGPTDQALFAVWEEIPVEVPISSSEKARGDMAHPFSGPLLHKVDRRVFKAEETSTITFQGKRLHRIESVRIDGVDMEVVSKSKDQITLSLPAMTVGHYTLVMESNSGRLTLARFIEVK